MENVWIASVMVTTAESACRFGDTAACVSTEGLLCSEDTFLEELPCALYRQFDSSRRFIDKWRLFLGSVWRRRLWYLNKSLKVQGIEITPTISVTNLSSFKWYLIWVLSLIPVHYYKPDFQDNLFLGGGILLVSTLYWCSSILQRKSQWNVIYYDRPILVATLKVAERYSL